MHEMYLSRMKDPLKHLLLYASPDERSAEALQLFFSGSVIR